jgi:deoxyadenosine/deoxycytidine kinase
MQEFLKHRRFAAYQFAVWGIRYGRFKGVVMDRSIHEDTVFAEINQKIGTIHPRNWNTYLQGFQDFTIFLPEPDVYVFLDADPAKCCERTRFRAESGERDEEKDTKFGEESGEIGIPLDYMRTLHAGYQKWLGEISPRIPTVRLDWGEFQDTTIAWKQIQDQVDQRSRFTRSLVT